MDEIDEMSIEGFEFLTDEENENNGKKVRFSSTKEVNIYSNIIKVLTNYFEIRRLPLRIGREAELARRSYNSSVDCTIPTISSPTLIIICVLLPTVYSFYIFTVLHTYVVFLPVAYLFFILSSFPSFHDTFFS